MTNEKVIEQLKAIRSDYRDDLRNYPELVKDDVEALDLAISALERDRWISVKDRLPEEGDYVIVYRRGGVYNQLDWVEEDCRRGDGFAKDNIDGMALYWMPLPELPKEET